MFAVLVGISVITALSTASAETLPECTPESLTQKIMTTRDGAWRPSHRFNEVYPNIVIGEGTNALIHPILQQLEITHVLNCAAPSDEDMVTRISRQVEYPHEYESEFNISVHGLPIHDTGLYRVGSLFQEGADFIEDVLTSGGRVYVNSFTGSSRAGTIVIGYFMIKHGYTAAEALHFVRLGREVRPGRLPGLLIHSALTHFYSSSTDRGFLEQLCALEKQLLTPTRPASTTTRPTIPANVRSRITTEAPTRMPPWKRPWTPPAFVQKWLNSFLG